MPTNRLTMEDAEEIADAIVSRQHHFLNEDICTSILTVLFNAGSSRSVVRCVGGEWSGVLRDVSKRGDGFPRCPQGHVLVQAPGVALGWVAE